MIQQFDWLDYNEELPPIGEIVLCFNPEWTNREDSYKGITIGFRTKDEDFVHIKYDRKNNLWQPISYDLLEEQHYSEPSKAMPTHWQHYPMPPIDNYYI